MLGGCLVTGGAGFIGSHLVDRLYRDRLCRSIYVIDDFSSGDIRNLTYNVKIYGIDISDPKWLDKDFLNSVDVIFHLAAVTNLDEVYADPNKAFKVNVLGTLNVAEACRRYNIKYLIYSSSVAVYGEPISLPISEDHPINPSNLYGLTKYLGELIVNEYSKEYDIVGISLRYFNVYGPRMRPGTYAGVIHKFISSLLNNESPVIYGDGSQTRDFIYVDDVINANILAVKYHKPDVFNIGTGVETNIYSLLNIIMEKLGKNIKPIYMPRRRGDIHRSKANYRKAMSLLGWRPKYSLDDGLDKTIKWYLNNMRRR